MTADRKPWIARAAASSVLSAVSVALVLALFELGLRLTALFDHSALFSYFTLALRGDSHLLGLLYRFGSPHVEQLDRASQVEHGDNLEGRLTTALVLALDDEVRRRGARFLLFGWSGHLAQLDLAAIAAAGIPVVSLAPIENDTADLIWHHDSHSNPEGHRRVADLLAPEIEAQLRARSPI